MKLPALWIAREGSFGVEDEPVKSGSFVGYRNGFFEGLRFFDSDGMEWLVERVILRRIPGLLDRLLNRRVEVDLEMAPPRQPPVTEIAEDLCACVDRDRTDLYDQFVGRDELKALFRAARSPSELIEHARSLGEADASEETA